MVLGIIGNNIGNLLRRVFFNYKRFNELKLDEAQYWTNGNDHDGQREED